MNNIENRYKVIRSDVVKFIKKFRSIKWDIIFIDPPYKIESELVKEIFYILSKRNIIDEKTIIMYEFFFKRDIKEEIKDFKILKKSFFGDKIVLYLSPL